MWDIFISHASEDKEEVARPLAEALQQAGLKVWYDEFSLTLGDSLRRSIDQGLRDSRFGLVILSPNFFDKSREWLQRELDGLSAREIQSGKVILPIWHQVQYDDVACYSPTLADKVSVSTDKGLDAVFQEVLAVFRQTPQHTGNIKKLHTLIENPLDTGVQKQKFHTIFNSRVGFWGIKIFPLLGIISALTYTLLTFIRHLSKLIPITMGF